MTLGNNEKLWPKAKKLLLKL